MAIRLRSQLRCLDGRVACGCCKRLLIRIILLLHLVDADADHWRYKIKSKFQITKNKTKSIVISQVKQVRLFVLQIYRTLRLSFVMFRDLLF